MYLTFQCSRRQIKIDFSALTNKEIAAQICIHRARNSQSIAESNIEKAKDERQKKITYKNKKKEKQEQKMEEEMTTQTNLCNVANTQRTKHLNTQY